MTDWTRGGIGWSLEHWVRCEVAEQLRDNPLFRRSRYPWPIRAMRRFFALERFSRFVAAYILVDLIVLNVEGWWRVAQGAVPAWMVGTTASGLLKDVSGYLIGAQVGILSVISLALALVTLIAQRDEASTDVQVYYHESMFFEITASCMALLAVLCVQLVWPLQFGLHLIGGGGHSTAFRLCLLAIHLGWFVVNLTAVAHFIGVTFRFVQRPARQKLRETYSANVVVPLEIAAKVRENMYFVAGSEAIPVADDAINASLFGQTMHGRYERDLVVHFRKTVRLRDVYIRPAHWAIQRWNKRCGFVEQPGAKPLGGGDRPRLWFTPTFDRDLKGESVLCHRRGGEPLDWIESLVLRHAFRFKKVRYEE